MKITKLIAAVIGVPMVIGSFALAVGGGIAIAVPDDDGWVSTGPVRMTTVEEAQTAIVAEIRNLEESGQIVVSRGSEEFVD